MNNQKHIAKAVTLLLLIALYGAFARAQAPAQKACVYVNDNLATANTVEGYMAAGTSITHLDPVATGGNGSPSNDHTFFATPLIAIAPGTTHLYASDSGSSDIALFNINSSNCQLTLVADYSSGGSGIFGLGITISRNGKFLYASNGGRSSSIAVLPINSDGSLGNPVQVMSVSAVESDIVITPDSKTMVVTHAGVSQQVAAYMINQSNGTLKLASTVSTMGAADGLAVDSHSKFIYVGNGGDGGAADIQVLELGAGAKLSYVADFVFNGIDNPASIPGSSNCLLLSPNGKFLYFTNQVDANIVTLSVDPASGNLSFSSIVADGESFVDEPSQLAMVPNGSVIFTGDFNSASEAAMGIFRASSNGVLTSLGSFPLIGDSFSTSIAAGVF